jgi:hypothetical protein
MVVCDHQDFGAPQAARRALRTSLFHIDHELFQCLPHLARHTITAPFHGRIVEKTGKWNQRKNDF